MRRQGYLRESIGSTVEDLYRGGHSARSIAQGVEVSVMTVYNILNERKVPLRHDKGRRA